MGLHIKLILLQIIILYWICNSSNAEPLYGKSESVIRVNSERKRSLALITDDYGVRLCTGILILRDKVLTAASCLEHKPTTSLRVVFGSTNPGHPIHKSFNVLSKVTYEHWCANKALCFYEKYTDDLCILKMDVVDTGITPIVIGGQLDQGLKTAKVAGWGPIYTNHISYPEKPREAMMTLLNKQECERRVRELVPSCLSDVVLPDKISCAASDPAVLAVEGDFGGPVSLLHHKQVSGILIQRCPSHLPLDDNAKQVNLILKLSYFKEFISHAVDGRIQLTF